MNNRLELDEAMLIFAFRYSLHKPLATAELCVNWIRFYKDKLSKETIDQICREIKVFIERGELFGKNEIILWYRLEQELKELNK